MSRKRATMGGNVSRVQPVRKLVSTAIVDARDALDRGADKLAALVELLEQAQDGLSPEGAAGLALVVRDVLDAVRGVDSTLSPNPRNSHRGENIGDSGTTRRRKAAKGTD